MSRLTSVRLSIRGFKPAGVAIPAHRLALMNHAASGTNIPFHAQALYERFRLETECDRSLNHRI